VLQNPAYAAVLERIAEGGAKEFYRGKLMQEMVKSLAIEGADLTEDDWRNYRARISPALCHPYRQYSVCTAPPPPAAWPCCRRWPSSTASAASMTVP